MFGKKKKKALTKQERRIASSVNTKPKKSFKQNKVNKTKVNDSKNKTNYLEKPIQGFYVDKVATSPNNKKQHISWQISADDKTRTRIGPLTHKNSKCQRYFKLRANHNPLDSEPSYLRKYVLSSPLGTRGKYMPNYKLSNDDYNNVIDYINRKQNNKKNT